MAIPNIFIEVTLVGGASAIFLVNIEKIQTVTPIAISSDPADGYRSDILMEDGTLYQLSTTYDEMKTFLLPPGT